MNKHCTKCHKEKDITRFSKNRSTSDGYQVWCKSCISSHYKHHKETIRSYKQNYYLNNKQAILKRIKNNYYKNIEVKKKQSNDYYHKHKHMDVYTNNRKIYSLKYRKINRTKLNNESIEWKRNHPENVRMWARKRRAMKQQVQENYNNIDAQFTKTLFNNTCVNCGSDINICIDHHYPLSKGNALTRKNAVILCRNCNNKKGCKSPEDFYSEKTLQQINDKLNNI